MSLLTRFDAWVGLRVFHPPIIRFCQLTGYTQHKLHRDIWFAVGLWLAWKANAEDRGWFIIGLLLVLCIFLGLRAAITPADFPGISWRFMRILWWLLVASWIPILCLTGGWIRLLDDVAILVAEYAATITTIPPRKPREKKTTQRREQHA